jgi:pimeloyl-ACP methyl ester carboxylesterase
MRTAMTGIGDPPLIFVHGFACDGTDWQPQRASLEKKTTVIVCELPGHGFSRGTSAECTIEAYGAAVAKTLRELPSRPVAGHEQFARTRPQCGRF